MDKSTQDWQAFLYLSGEMSPDEQGAFEQRLAEDLSLCERVAESVGLVSAIHVAESSLADKCVTPANVGAGRISRWLVWTAVASSLALGSFWALRSPTLDQEGEDPRLELALAWTEQLHADPQNTPVLVPADEEDSPLSGLAILTAGEIEVDELEAPTWIELGASEVLRRLEATQ